jgi:hypothetical protein
VKVKTTMKIKPFIISLTTAIAAATIAVDGQDSAHEYV